MLRAAGRLLFLAPLLLALAACEKTKPVADTPAPAASPSSAPPSASALGLDKVRSPASGSNAFAFDLWSVAAKRTPGNFVLSPASLSLAFAMAYGGAKGETAEQIKKVLHFAQQPEAVMTSWGAVRRSLSDPGRPIKLHVANRLFGEKTYRFEATYLDRTRAAFGAPLEAVDFKSAPDAARRQINAWVEGQTEARIKDLLPPDAVKPLTRLVLVNALTFVGDWAEPFDAALTRPEPFETSATTKRTVPTMHHAGRLAAGRAPGVKLVELPYKGRSASLLVVVPDKIDGLPAVESALTSATLESWTHALEPKDVVVSLPRFELSPAASLSLAADLQTLGLSLPFDAAKADLTAIAHPSDPSERVHLDDVVHKAFVKVDERGTEAAAATALAAMGAGPPPTQLFEVKADRPFLFFVIDKEAGLVLFMGRVADPT